MVELENDALLNMKINKDPETIDPILRLEKVHVYDGLF
jgi:hypothetical protein